MNGGSLEHFSPLYFCVITLISSCIAHIKRNYIPFSSVFVFHLDLRHYFVMSFKDLKAKRDNRRVTTATASLALPSETQLQDPQLVSNPSPKGYDDLQAARTLYDALLPNTKIQETVERGRGLWTTRPISAGNVHRIELPLLYLTI